MKVFVVGAGFTGATVARVLAEAGVSVRVVDKRGHIGGNAHDGFVNGTRVHTYGPHLFHTNSQRVIEFLSRFTFWRPYEHRVLAATSEGKIAPLPIIRRTAEVLLEEVIETPEAFREVLRREVSSAEGHPLPATLKHQSSYALAIDSIGPRLTEALFTHYTQKQWGRPLQELSTRVISRIPIRFDDDDRYFTDEFQAIPLDGYTSMFSRMLDHPNIDLELGEKVLHVGEKTGFDRVVWTGPMDEYYDHCYGKLGYRSLEFKLTPVDGRELTPQERLVLRLGYATVNFTGPELPFTRITNFGKLPGAGDDLLCTEYPRAEGEPYYPTPSQENFDLYKRYEELHQSSNSNVVFAGRLGKYQYYNMDQACAQGLSLAADILREGSRADKS